MLSTVGERWLPVPEWEGLYDVSDIPGRVRSLDRTVVTSRGSRHYQGHILKPTLVSGYPTVTLSDPVRGQVNHGVHRLVLAAFVGPCPPGQECRHGPNGKLDPSLPNLCYGTRKENFADRLRDGQDNRGEKHGLAVLNREIVLDIRRRFEAGERQVDIAVVHGISKALVWTIVHRVSWDWL